MKKNAMVISIAALTVSFLVGAGAIASEEAKKVDYTKMTPEALAEYLIFESGSYDLAIATQEGKTGKDRMVQDELQKLCSAAKDGKPDVATLAQISATARETIKYPEGGIKLGNWKNGRVLAWSGFGFRLGHSPDKHESQPEGAGANCYNCHQLATDRTGGNLGPSLVGYGTLRGRDEAIMKYTYGVIYNAHAYFPCTNMPRMGANNLLSTQQIADVMAYLFDPESPVNK